MPYHLLKDGTHNPVVSGFLHHPNRTTILRDITVRQYGQRTSFLQQIFLHNSLFHKQCISPYFSPSLSHSFNFHLSIHYTIDPVVLEGSMHYTYLVIMIRMDTHYYFQFYDFQFFLSS